MAPNDIGSRAFPESRDIATAHPIILSNCHPVQLIEDPYNISTHNTSFNNTSFNNTSLDNTFLNHTLANHSSSYHTSSNYTSPNHTSSNHRSPNDSETVTSPNDASTILASEEDSETVSLRKLKCLKRKRAWQALQEQINNSVDEPELAQSKQEEEEEDTDSDYRPTRVERRVRLAARKVRVIIANMELSETTSKQMEEAERVSESTEDNVEASPKKRRLNKCVRWADESESSELCVILYFECDIGTSDNLDTDCDIV